MAPLCVSPSLLPWLSDSLRRTTISLADLSKYSIEHRRRDQMPTFYRADVPIPPIPDPYLGTPGFSLPPGLLVTGHNIMNNCDSIGNSISLSSTSRNGHACTIGSGAGHTGKRSRSSRSETSSLTSATKKKRKSRHRTQHEPYR